MTGVLARGALAPSGWVPSPCPLRLPARGRLGGGLGIDGGAAGWPRGRELNQVLPPPLTGGPSQLLHRVRRPHQPLWPQCAWHLARSGTSHTFAHTLLHLECFSPVENFYSVFRTQLWRQLLDQAVPKAPSPQMLRPCSPPVSQSRPPVPGAAPRTSLSPARGCGPSAPQHEVEHTVGTQCLLGLET